MKKLTIIIVVILLILQFTFTVYCEEKPIAYDTYYKLDTGVIWMWRNSAGVWQNGIEPGEYYDYTKKLSIELPKGAIEPDVYPLELDPYYEEDNFEFSLDDSHYQWYDSTFVYDVDTYIDMYFKRSCEEIIVSEAVMNDGKAEFDMSVKLIPYDGLDEGL